jgi:phenylpropionate dioxygenase-like ring-hydroxylating dioxygenase large terminal subunit
MTLQNSSRLSTLGMTRPRMDLESLVQEDRVHRTLYTDPDIFEREMAEVFGGRSWAYLAHESQVAEPNSFLSLRLGMRPIIVTRDRDGVIHGLFNRCSHRAATVCREEKGTAKTFQCPYHGWTFRNTGKLVGASWPQGYGKDFDKKSMVSFVKFC